MQVEDCTYIRNMKLLRLFGVVVSITVVTSIAVPEKCDKIGVLMYEDMKCNPIYDKNINNSCPIKYNCKGLHKSSNICYHQAKTYKLETQVNSDLTASNCDLGCYCTKQKTGNGTQFTCATVDCPEWSSPPRLGCYRKYSLDACCSVREICPPFDNSTTCLYDGKIYKEGENFLPRESCWRCVCQEGFRGKIEMPFCRRRTCGVQIKHQDKLQKLCAPIYYKRMYKKDQLMCCPSSWICAEGDEKISGKAKSNISCRFGSKTLKIGEGFTKIQKDAVKMRKITCECRIPPLLTCETEI